mgnify:CR=1 FL=1
MEKTEYSVNEFIFRENNSLVLQQEFKDSIKIKGYTDNGVYTFEYKQYKDK